MAKKYRAPTVFFPWERRPGVFGAIGRTRAGAVLLTTVVVAFLLVVRQREEHAAAVRATRATLTVAREAVSLYRSDHGGKCPGSLADVINAKYTRSALVDAWGRGLRLTCPGRVEPRGFDLSSDGPDGLPGGLDRVE